MSEKNLSEKQLSEAAKLAKKVSEDFQSLWAMLGNGSKPINQFQEVGFLKLVDEINNIKNELVALTDGRPVPLDMSAKYVVPEENRGNYPQGALDEIEETVQKHSRFGECYGRSGQKTLACVGSVEMEKAELLRLRDWIDAVIKWHESNPTKPNKSSPVSKSRLDA